MNELALLLLLLAAPAEEPAPTSQSPYQLSVCLRVADDPLLTERFVNSVSREVRDQLRNFFGPLADVTVVTSGHWLIDDYADDDVNLPFLDAEIMEARELTEQAFVFRISFDRTHYHVRWRQLDGQSGQIGPIMSKQTPDRQWVAKTICLAVRDDFAVRARITPGSTPASVQVSFVGKQHKPYLERVLGERIFMQLYWVQTRRTGTLRTAVPHTLVLWAKEKDRYSTSIISNASPWSRKAGVTYEAVRIHTQPGRLRLHLVDQERSTPVTNRTVSVNDRGFDSLTTSDILPNAKNSRGVLLSPNILHHVAYVRIEQGGGVFVDVPLPITQEICDHVLPIAADKQILAKNDYERNLRFLTQDLQTLSTIQSATAVSANELNGRKRYEDALKSVEELVSVSGPQLSIAARTLYDLQQQATTLQIKRTRMLELAATELKQRQERHREFSEFKGTIRSSIEKRDAQGRSNVLIKLGEQAERDADYEEALTRYELALGEQPDQPALTEKLEGIKEQWRIKGPSHETARELVYDRWANAEVTEIAALLPEVERALTELQAVGDRLTARKLQNVTIAHSAALNDLISRLAERSSEEDRKELEKYDALNDKLLTLLDAVTELVKQPVSEPEAGSDSDESAPKPPTNFSQDPSSLLDLDEAEEKPLNDDRGNK